MNIKRKDNSISARKGYTSKSILITVVDEFGNTASKILSYKGTQKFIDRLKKLING
jgi:hypothetical protein